MACNIRTHTESISNAFVNNRNKPMINTNTTPAVHVRYDLRRVVPKKVVIRNALATTEVMGPLTWQRIRPLKKGQYLKPAVPNEDHKHDHDDSKEVVEDQRSCGNGKFGRFGGKFVPETLVACLSELESHFNMAMLDADFQKELEETLRDYVGRETPLYFAERLTNYYKNKNKNGEGPEIYLKREDLNHGGSHKINNAVAQAMLAKRMGAKRVITATGAGQHGVATAAACTRLGLDCTVLMGSDDMEKQASNVVSMRLLGAQIVAVDGNFKDATSEAIRQWVGDLKNSYYLIGTAVGPHPCPSMVREFQSIIGKETRRQAMEKWGGKPDVLVACVGSGSNALGLFHEFIDDEDVRLVGIEAGGNGGNNSAATMAKGEVGSYHGAMSYLLQDEEGQIVTPHSIAVGMEYPGVAPELSYLKDTGQIEFYSVTDQEAVDAYQKLCRLEGIIPCLEASHALAYLEKLCPQLPNGKKVVVNCSGRGDKDAQIVNMHQFMISSNGWLSQVSSCS